MANKILINHFKKQINKHLPQNLTLLQTYQQSYLIFQSIFNTQLFTLNLQQNSKNNTYLIIKYLNQKTFAIKLGGNYA